MVTKRDGRTMDRAALEYIRINAIERWLSGETPRAIIEDIGFCETTIYKWIATYREGGMDALKRTIAPGAASKLSDDQKAQIKDLIVGKEPTEHGFEYNLWTRQIVSELIEEKFNIKLGLSQVGVLLADLNITPQKPERQAREQDPDAVQEWTEDTFPTILTEAKQTGAEVFFLDEAGYSLDDQIGRTWGQRGETPVVKSTGKRARINSMVAMSLNGAFWYEEFQGNLNSDRFCDIFDRFIKTRRKHAIVIMDRHPTHTSNLTSEYFQSLANKLSVYMLPAYSPDLNPVEYINHYAKKIGPRKKLPRDKRHLSEIVQAALDSLKCEFKKVRSFLNHPDLEYINP